MKHPDSETLQALKDTAETDPMRAVDDLLGRVLAGDGTQPRTRRYQLGTGARPAPPSVLQRSGAYPRPQEA